MKIQTGDNVKVLSGKARGKTGPVERVLAKEGKVVVAGVNVVKRHLRNRGARTQPGGIVEKTLPIPASSVMVICPHCNQAMRVGYTVDGGRKQRICRKCQKVLLPVKK